MGPRNLSSKFRKLRMATLWAACIGVSALLLIGFVHGFVDGLDNRLG
jgi:hypothetical protein